MPYNTVPFHGKVSRVEKNNVAMEYSQGWSLNASLDMAEANRNGQDWKEALPGQAGWNGSFSGMFVAGNTEQKAFFDNLVAATPGTKLTDVKFLLDGATNAFTGDIFIIGLSVAPSLTEVVKFTINFQGNGALTLTNAA
jgi:predicted secreted protein